jgi:exonuclease 3'-5' domain-containing protein 1
MKDVKTEIIDTAEHIGALVDWLIFRHAAPVPHSPTMYLDLEGVNLCCKGSISILTLLIHKGIPIGRACLIDIHRLGAQAFQTAGAKQKTLQDVLQDEKIPKVFFDVRNDSDTLFAHFGITLQGVEDVQLMESATRKTTASRKFSNGLTHCVECIPCMGDERSQLAKQKGEELFNPKHGGTYVVFNIRPIPRDMIFYCVGDVQYLPELREKLCSMQTLRWRNLVIAETRNRVAITQRLDCQPHGLYKRMAPWSGKDNITLYEWNYTPSQSFGHRNGWDDDMDDN